MLRNPLQRWWSWHLNVYLHISFFYLRRGTMYPVHHHYRFKYITIKHSHKSTPSLTPVLPYQAIVLPHIQSVGPIINFPRNNLIISILIFWYLSLNTRYYIMLDVNYFIILHIAHIGELEHDWQNNCWSRCCRTFYCRAVHHAQGMMSPIAITGLICPTTTPHIASFTPNEKHLCKGQ